MAKGKGGRGAKFATAELEHLLSIVEEILPIGAPEWERVWDRHDSAFRAKERTPESLKRKFQELARKKIPTGDPECPPHVRKAKHIYHKIILATDGSTGGSDAGLGFEVENDGDDDDDDDEKEEEEEEEEGDGSFGFSVDREQDPEEGVEPVAVAPAAVAPAARSLSSSSGTISSSKGNKRKEGGGGQSRQRQAVHSRSP
jgi:hypothetical protein